MGIKTKVTPMRRIERQRTAFKSGTMYVVRALITKDNGEPNSVIGVCDSMETFQQLVIELLEYMQPSTEVAFSEKSIDNMAATCKRTNKVLFTAHQQPYFTSKLI